MASEWQELTLEQSMAALIDYRGKTPRKVPRGVPLITAKVVKTGRIETPNEFIAEEDYDEWMRRGLPQRGDVVLTTEAPLGEVAQLEDARVALAQRLVCLRGRPGLLDNDFLKFLMQSTSVQEQLHARASGTTVLGIKQSELRKIVLSLPPLQEQRAIAHILGTLDDKIELNRRISETLETIARALFHSWFVDFDPVRAKADGRDTGLPNDLADLFPESFDHSVLGEVPTGWRHCPLGDLVELTRGRTYKSSLKDLPGPVLLGLAAIERNGGFRDDKLSTYGGDSPTELLLSPGELFVSLKDVTQSADLLGAIARVPPHVQRGRLTQDTVKLTFRSSPTSHNLVYRTLLTQRYREYCRSHATGTTNLGLSRDDFLAYPVVQPSAEVQHIFDATIDSIDARAASATTESRTLADLRDVLLPKLLFGELRVKQAERVAVEAAGV